MAPGRVAAQVTMEVHLGLQDTVRLEKWNLVTVHLFNAGVPLEGTLGVRVWRGSEFRQDRHVATFTQVITLPQRARKRFAFTVPITSISHPVEVFLQQHNNIIAQQQLDLHEALSAEHVILGLSRDLGLDFLATNFEQHTRIAYLPPQELPQLWSGYDSVSAMVVKGVSLQSLTDKQATALRQWLARGGTLVVAGDSQYALLQEPRVRTLLPVEVLGVQQLEGLAAFAERYNMPLPATPLLAVQSRLRSGQVVVGTAEAPLLAERSFGKGRVVFLAVDYAAQPLAGWPGNTALWRDILRPAEQIDFGRVFAELGLLDESHPIIKVLRRPVLAFPSHLTLSLMLLVYCGGLGLLFWRMGKRQARPWRYWVGVVGLILGATVGAYAVFPEQGLQRSALLMDLTTAEVLPDTDYAQVHGYLGLFSTRGGRYTLDVQPPESILRHTFSRGVGKAGEAIEITAAASMSMRGIALEPWALRVFNTEGIAPAPLRIEAWGHAGGVTLLVKNHGPLPIQGAAVVYQGRLFGLGVVAPGEEVFEDLYTTLQPVESRQETTWQALFKLRPAAADPRLAYFQEVLLQHFFGEKRLEAHEAPFFTGWVMVPTTLQQEEGGLAVRGMTLVVGRLPL
jgi:hypothetical protein